MSGNELTGYIITILILVVFSGYFSATETAFTSLNRIRMKSIADSGDQRSKLVLELSENYDKLLSTILIGNNIVNIAATAIATLLFVTLYGQELGATLSTIVITIVVLIFGEISPKSIAKEKPEQFAMFAAPFIHIIQILLTPLNWFFSVWKKMLRRLFCLDNEDHITTDELITFVEEAETEGGINEDQSELIQNAIEFNDCEVWDVMTPRVDVVAIQKDIPNEKIAEVFRETGFSRLPVYDEDMDSICGVLNEKDFHNYVLSTGKAIAEYIRPVVYVPGATKVPLLLKKMQRIKTHIAVIVDEYGGVLGIATMEDLIEELVGEIYDEHDEPETPEITPLPDGSYLVLGSANVEKMFDCFDVDVDMDATTVNGWLVSEFHDFPKCGGHLDYEAGDKRFHVTVTKADQFKALEVSLLVEDVPEESQEEA